MGGQTASARGSRWSRCAVLLGIAVVVWLLGATTQTAGAAPLASDTPIAAGRVATSSGLNMRAAPQTGAAVLRVLPFLTEVYILGAEIERDGHRWVPIRLKPEHGGQQGWVARRWLVAVPLHQSAEPGGPGGPGLRLLKGSGPAQYAVVGGVRYLIADLTTLHTLRLGGYEQVTDAEIAALREGTTLRFHPGTLLRDDAGRVWQIGAGGQRHWVPDLATFNVLGFTWDRVQQAPDWAVGRLAQGTPLTAR